MYGEGAVTDRTYQKWFANFGAGDSSPDGAPWTLGRPVEVDSDQLETLIKHSQHYTTQEKADVLKIPKSVLKIIYSSLVMLMALMFGFHIS